MQRHTMDLQPWLLPVKPAAVSAESHLCKTVITGEAAFLARRADVDYPTAEGICLHLHEALLWIDCFVVAFNAVWINAKLQIHSWNKKTEEQDAGSVRRKGRRDQ